MTWLRRLGTRWLREIFSLDVLSFLFHLCSLLLLYFPIFSKRCCRHSFPRYELYGRVVFAIRCMMTVAVSTRRCWQNYAVPLVFHVYFSPPHPTLLRANSKWTMWKKMLKRTLCERMNDMSPMWYEWCSIYLSPSPRKSSFRQQMILNNFFFLFLISISFELNTLCYREKKFAPIVF